MYEHYYNNNNYMKNLINKLIYSILTVNANISDNITIYTDFDGYSILSTLFPINCKLVFNKNYDVLKKEIISSQKQKYLLMNSFDILKLFIDFKENYIINNSLNKNSLDKSITDKYIEEMLKDIFSEKYYEVLNKNNERVNILKLKKNII